MIRDLFERFARSFGTPNFVDGRSSHTAPLRQAMKASLGVDEIPAWDWEGARHVLSLEAGLFEESCQSVYMSRVASAARTGSSRAKLTHLGSLFDLSAYNADDWFRIRPGTSGAVALAIARILIKSNRVAPGLAERTEGFEAFSTAIDPWTAERASTTSGMPVQDIESLAEELWLSRPAFVVVDERSVSFTNGYETVNAAFALNAILGAVESAPAGLRLPAEQPLASWPEVEIDEIAKAGLAKPRLDRADSSEFDGASGVLDNLPAGMIGKKAVDVALLYYSNPTYARPQPAQWTKALSEVPLVVSFSPFLDETAAESAHFVLPDHTFLERWEDAAAAPGPPRSVVGIRRPVVEPLHDTRASADVLLSLAVRVGGTVAKSLPWRNVREAIDQRLLGLRKVENGSIKRSSDHRFLRALYHTGVWSVKGEVPPKTDVKFRFQTGYAGPAWKGDPNKYPLRMIAYRPLGYAVGGSANLPWLRTLRPRPHGGTNKLLASMHPDSALIFEVADGEPIHIESPFGTIEAHALIDKHMEPGVVAVPLGGGRRAMGRWAMRADGNVMELLEPTPAPGSGAGSLCTTRVRLARRKA
jgi:anaerobic selenocysteine-containing dehydrogenase